MVYKVGIIPDEVTGDNPGDEEILTLCFACNEGIKKGEKQVIVSRSEVRVSKNDEYDIIRGCNLLQVCWKCFKKAKKASLKFACPPMEVPDLVLDGFYSYAKRQETGLEIFLGYGCGLCTKRIRKSKPHIIIDISQERELPDGRVEIIDGSTQFLELYCKKCYGKLDQLDGIDDMVKSVKQEGISKQKKLKNKKGN